MFISPAYRARVSSYSCLPFRSRGDAVRVRERRNACRQVMASGVRMSFKRPSHASEVYALVCRDMQTRRTSLSGAAGDLMQLPDEAIAYDYHGLLIPVNEEWTPAAELRQQHFLAPAAVKD